MYVAQYRGGVCCQLRRLRRGIGRRRQCWRSPLLLPAHCRSVRGGQQYCFSCCTSTPTRRTCTFHFNSMGVTAQSVRLAAGLGPLPALPQAPAPGAAASDPAQQPAPAVAPAAIPAAAVQQQPPPAAPAAAAAPPAAMDLASAPITVAMFAAFQAQLQADSKQSEWRCKQRERRRESR